MVLAADATDFLTEENSKFSASAARHGYLTAPLKTSRMPPGIPYIVGNEAAERFSFYGMRAILVTFMTQYLLNAQGQPAHMSESRAKVYFHLFVASVYLSSVFGAILADAFWGKYRTIILLSLVYCGGHAALAANDTKIGLLIGLFLIALGAGGIKPCVSANVGDQFGTTNQRLIPKVFSWFYFSINFGATIATLIIPTILHGKGRFSGPHFAFALPGILMLIATVIFWLGRRKFAHIPPAGLQFFRDIFTRESIRIIGRLYIIFAFVAVFWALFDQTSSAWVLQAEKMNLHLFGREWTAEQFQALNPIFILILIPVFSYGIYPLFDKFYPLTPLRRLGVGLFMPVVAFALSAAAEHRITLGEHPTILWQVAAYVIMTAGEVLVSITALEFSYTQAPKKLKSMIMAFYLTSVTMGDLFVAAVNKFIENPDKTTKLAGASYYVFFAAVMLGAALIYLLVAPHFKTRTFVQDEVAEPI